MINRIQLSFFSNYIYAPKIWLHSLSVRQKIWMMSIYLICIPSIPLSMFIWITIVISCIFISIARDNESNYIYKILFALSIYCLLLLLITNISSITGNYLLITIPYQLKIQWLNKSLQTISGLYYKNIITISISNLIIRSLLLVISYYLFYQLIIFTTQIEDILIYNLCTMNFIAKNISISSISDIIFILILSYEYISILEINIENIITSLIIRGQSFYIHKNYHEFSQICILILNIVKNQVNEEIYATNSIIYTRELNMSLKDKWLTT